MGNDEGKKWAVKAILDSIVKKIKTGNDVFLFMLMAGLALVLGANITMRYLFSHPISWSNTISRYAYIYIVLLGTAVSYIEGQHATIDFLYFAVSRKFKMAFDFVHFAVMMFVSIVLIVSGIKHSIAMWHVSAPILPWLPVGIVYLSVPICAFVILVFLLQKMLEIKA